MSDQQYPVPVVQYNNGCLGIPFLMWVVILLGGAFFLLFPGDNVAYQDRSGADTTMPIASGNEVLSRNQANLFSEVTNNFFDCIGAGSCIVTADNSAETSDTTNTTVEGDRNTVGQALCPDPNNPNMYIPCQ